MKGKPQSLISKPHLIVALSCRVIINTMYLCKFGLKAVRKLFTTKVDDMASIDIANQKST